MLRSVLLAALVLAPVRAHAGVGDELDLMAQLRSPDARVRATAARTVAERATRGDRSSVFIASTFVFTDDRTVHAAFVDALAAAGVIAPATRAFVPLASVLEDRLRQQLAGEKPERLPRANQCKVVGGSSRGAELECGAPSYCSSAGVVDRTFSITTGVRWTIEVDQRVSESDRCPSPPK